MILIINPNLVIQKSDIFTTGIVYMPIGLAYLTAKLKQDKKPFKVIDMFGEAPNKTKVDKDYIFRGLDLNDLKERIPSDTEAAVIYAINTIAHVSLTAIIRELKESKPSIKIIILENSQSVTAYSLWHVKDELFAEGADYLIQGDPEKNIISLLEAISAGTSAPAAVLSKNKNNLKPESSMIKEDNLDVLPFPAWEEFPVKNYWKLGYAHGPLKSDKYLPILTSRGCPFDCGFCVIPDTNGQKWRPRSAKIIVDEMEHFINRFKVSEFHIEDLNPTVDDNRMKELSREIIQRKLSIIWKISAGTKCETIKNKETIGLMYQAGCRYVSISPETASDRLLALMNKPFDKEHSKLMISEMNRTGIRTQACFVIGYPEETDEDRELTFKYAKELTKLGLDEIAVFIAVPIPGSKIFDKFSGYNSMSQLTFSPGWRKDYKQLNSFRLKMYSNFLIWKLTYHPFKVLKQAFNFITRKFETKMEMTPYRVLHTKYLLLKNL